MSGGDTASLVMKLIWIVILISSLAAMRLPLGKTVKMALAWVGVFSVAFIGFSFRYEAKQVWNRVASELTGEDPVGVDGSVRLTKRDDGHFWANATINGTQMSLMVDSGATVTSISAETARATKVTIDTKAFPAVIDTANGVVEAQRGTIDAFAIGPIQRAALPVFVSASFGDTNVIGMNFLSSLKSWKVEGDVMMLTP
jgi:aspartyl protease family protein